MYNIGKIYGIFYNLWDKLSFFKKAFFISFCGIIFLFPLLNFFATEHDEQYTMLLFQYSWKDMLKIIMSEDGHPPLSYIYQRLWSLGTWNNIFMLHMSSLFVLLMMVLLGCYPIRRLCGDKVALIFIFLTFAMPSSFRMASNMRMYPLAVFFITGVFVYSQNILLKYRKSDWIFLTLFSILGMYTYYYCVIYSAIIWLLLLYNLIISKQYKQLKNFFISGTCVALLYLPWLYVFFSQFNYMKEVWYPSIQNTVESLDGLLLMFYVHDSKNVGYLVKVSTNVLSVYAWLLIIQAATDKKNSKNHTIIKNFLLMSIIFWVLGFTISLMIRPILHLRYLIVQIGTMYLALACAYINFKQFRKLFLGILLLAFILNYSQYREYAKDESYQKFQYQIRKNIPKDSLVIYNNSSGKMAMKYYLPEYKTAYVPLIHDIVLLQDRVVAEKKNLKNLRKYKNIYYLSPLIPGMSCDEFIGNTFYIPYTFCLSKLTVIEAKDIIKQSQEIITY